MGYSVRSDRYRYTEWRTMRSTQVVARELYDHEKDAGEAINVVAQQPETAEQHAALLRKTFPEQQWTDSRVLNRGE